MSPQSVGIYSARGDLSQRLRETCPDVNFAPEGAERDASRVAVIDTDSHSILDSPARKSLVKIVLCDHIPSSPRRKGEMRVERAAFLASPAEYIGVAFDLAETVTHASHLELEVNHLNEVHDMMTMVEADEVSERITLTVLGILGLAKGTLFLHDPRLERYVVSFSNDDNLRESGEFLPGVPPDLLQRALASGQFFASDRNPNGTGLVIMPLQMQDDLIGVIRVPLLKESTFSAEAAANVSRYLVTVTQVLGYGAVFSIIFLDLDDLKMVNNFYGHLTGSRTLQEVAKRILGAVRAIDKVVRFGGDEFCIILPQTDQDQAMAVARRVRKAMSATAFRLDPAVEISITASFGIASYPTHAMTKEDLVRQADAAMYRVKSTTKNEVGIAIVENATKPAAL